jgi:PKD repeat protein
MKTSTLFKAYACVLSILLSLQSVYAQPAKYDKNKLRDPMIMKPGYDPSSEGQLRSSVVTFNDYDNFLLGRDFAECSVTNNPLNPLQFYATWNSTSVAGGKGYYTNDGYTWTAKNPSWTNMMGDVVVTYDGQGRLFYQNMYGNIDGSKVAVSTDNGATWNSFVNAVVGVDKNWLAADQTDGPFANYVFNTMTASSGGNFSRSTDNGYSYQNTKNFSTQSNPGMMVAVGPNGSTDGGSVYVVTNNGSSFASTYTFYQSTDGGLTFTQQSQHQYSNYVGSNVNGRNSVQNMRTRPYPFIAADNSTGPHRGRLYLVYASNNPAGNGNKPDIFCRYSDDAAATWSSAVIINDDANSQNNNNWFPAVWCDKETGRFYVSWLDTRDSPTSDSCLLYASYSDDGVTFAPNVPISQVKFKINCTTCGGAGTPAYLGDYNGVASHKFGAMVAWTDFRVGKFDSYVAYFPDFAMRMEPALDTLEASADFLFKVPDIKLYTDTAFISVALDASAASLFDVTFPNGNKLWSYPGELPISVVPTGAVPMGDYTMTVNANGKNGTPVHKRIVTIRAINPLPPVCNFMVSDTTSCEGYSLNFQDLSSGPPTSWQWSFPGGNPETSDVKNPQGIVYSTAGDYDVSLTVTNQVGTDTRIKTSYISVAIVPPAPAATGTEVCFGQPVPDLTATGTDLQWYYYDFPVGSGSIYTPLQTDPGVYEYTVTQTVNGCSSPAATVTLVINALPDITFNPMDSICGNTAPFNLTAAIPAGGIYTGPGVTGTDLFDASLAGIGTHTLTYTYTDEHGCVDSATQTVKVLPLAVVAMDPVASVCYGTAPVELAGTPAHGVFSGTGVTGNQFDPTASGPGTFTLTYTILDTVTDCNVWASQDVTVHPLPNPQLSNQSMCGNRTVLIDAASQDYTSYLWQPGGETTSAIQVDTIGRGLGTFEFIVAITDINSCNNTDSVSVNFYDCTGIDEPGISAGLDIYPNPGNGLVTLHSLVVPAGDYSLKVYNTLNSLVFTEPAVNVKGELLKNLDLRHLASGVYLLRFENATTGWSKQLIIKR